MKKYLVEMVLKEDNHAGPKAKMDASEILEDMGFEKILIPTKIPKIKKFFTLKKILKKIFSEFKKEDIVLIQYPTFGKYSFKKIISLLTCKKVLLIHDINSLRFHSDRLDEIRKEIDIFNKFDVLIVHNAKMKKWLEENGVKVNLIELDIFDYLSPNFELRSFRKGNNKAIVYAGNLNKSDFLKKYRFQPIIDLYGLCDNEEVLRESSVRYNGVLKPEDVPNVIKEYQFGLVWDGENLDTCTGIHGEYMKYNNPHKVSLYLSSGLPIIIWRQAALASFIEKYNLGIIIDGLENLDEIISNISDEEYNSIRLNVERVSERIRSGYYLKKAIIESERLF